MNFLKIKNQKDKFKIISLLSFDENDIWEPILLHYDICEKLITIKIYVSYFYNGKNVIS